MDTTIHTIIAHIISILNLIQHGFVICFGCCIDIYQEVQDLVESDDNDNDNGDDNSHSHNPLNANANTISNPNHYLISIMNAYYESPPQRRH